MTSEKRVNTWTFDKACTSMEVTELHKADLSIAASIDGGSDLIILGVFGPSSEGVDEGGDNESQKATLSGQAKDLDGKFGGALTEAMAENQKAFKDGSSVGSTIPTIRIVSAGEKTKRVVLLGLGAAGKGLEDGVAAKIGQSLASACDTNKKVKSCSLVLPEGSKGISLSDLSTEFYSSLYSDNRYRTGDKIVLKAEDLESVGIVFEDDVVPDEANAAIAAGKSLAAGVSMAKDIVNAPHNVLNSESMANVARLIAEESGGTISCKILGKEECEARGMGAYLGVARGSETDPQFIHMTYTPKNGTVR